MKTSSKSTVIFFRISIKIIIDIDSKFINDFIYYIKKRFRLCILFSIKQKVFRLMYDFNFYVEQY